MLAWFQSQASRVAEKLGLSFGRPAAERGDSAVHASSDDSFMNVPLTSSVVSLDDFVKTSPIGLMVAANVRHDPAKWHMNTILSADRLVLKYMMDPRFTEPNGMVHDGDLADLWRSLERFTVAGIPWESQSYSSSSIQSFFEILERHSKAHCIFKFSDNQENFLFQ